MKNKLIVICITLSNFLFCQQSIDSLKVRFNTALDFIEQKEFQTALDLLELNIQKYPSTINIDYSFAWATYCHSKLQQIDEFLVCYSVMRTKYCNVSLVNNKYRRNWDEFLWKIIDSLQQNSLLSEDNMNKIRAYDSLSVRIIYPDYKGGSPFITKSNQKYLLVIPALMENALKEYDSTFQIFNKSYYLDLPVFYEFSTFAAPFAIVGDFNGDKIFDLIVHGYTSKNKKILAIISNSENYEVMMVADFSTNQTASFYLNLINKWGINLEEDNFPDLKNDALWIFNENDKQGWIYYYNDNKFIKIEYSNWE